MIDEDYRLSSSSVPGSNQIIIIKSRVAISIYIDRMFATDKNQTVPNTIIQCIVNNGIGVSEKLHTLEKARLCDIRTDERKPENF